MTELTTSVINYDELEKNGRNIYKNNHFLRSLTNVMEHPEFRNFFSTYIKDWSDVKTISMFMKLYEQTEKNNNFNLSNYQKLSIINEIIGNSKTRKQVVDDMTSSINKESTPMISYSRTNKKPRMNLI
jgi:hypothetical protein